MAPGKRRRSLIASSDTQNATSTSETIVAASNIEKKRRGISRGLKLDRLMTSAKGKLHVDFSGQVPKGANVEMLSSEIGVVVRSHAPLNVNKWDSIPKEQIQPLIDRVLSKFDIDISIPYVREWVIKKMRVRFNGFRHKLHQEFLKFSSKTIALENRPSYIDSQDDWKFLCDRFDEDGFKNRSEKNKQNRGNLPFEHRGGSKSFAQHTLQMESENGEALGKIQLFKKLHYSDEKGWVKEDAKALHETMENFLNSQTSEDGSEPLSEEEICIKVLGNNSGYLKGLGIINPKRPTSNVIVTVEDDRVKQKFELQDKTIQELKEQNARIMELLAKFAPNSMTNDMDQV